MDLHARKSEQRAEIRRRIQAMDPTRRREADAALGERLLAALALRFAGRSSEPPLILGYVPLDDEVAIRPVLEEILHRRWCLALPRIAGDDRLMLHRVHSLGEDLVMGRWSILEPRRELPVVMPVDLDAVLVPGRAFDPAGGRLGRGKAYYDRLLGTTRAWRIAVAYEAQILDDLARDETDEAMDRVLTPSRTLGAERDATRREADGREST